MIDWMKAGAEILREHPEIFVPIVNFVERRFPPEMVKEDIADDWNVPPAMPICSRCGVKLLHVFSEDDNGVVHEEYPCRTCGAEPGTGPKPTKQEKKEPPSTASSSSSSAPGAKAKAAAVKTEKAFTDFMAKTKKEKDTGI